VTTIKRMPNRERSSVDGGSVASPISARRRDGTIPVPEGDFHVRQEKRRSDSADRREMERKEAEQEEELRREKKERTENRRKRRTREITGDEAGAPNFT